MAQAAYPRLDIDVALQMIILLFLKPIHGKSKYTTERKAI
jgi:hypothetical protein